MAGTLPFPITARRWDDLAGPERDFFVGDEYLPLHPSHAAQIRLLDRESAARVNAWADGAIPPGWPERPAWEFPHRAELPIADYRNDPAGPARVRRWLFDRGVPLARPVYLLDDRSRVVEATWRMVVRYWDAFEGSVGYAMHAVDHTRRWAGCFHHESWLVFGSHAGFGRASPAGRPAG